MSDTSVGSTEPEPGTSTGGRVGGTTGDFGGRCACTVTTRELELSEVDAVLGFSAQAVLERLEGAYTLPMAWGDECENEEPEAEGCTDSPPEFTGSETEVQLAIAHAGTTARVEECKPEASNPDCHITWLYVPVAGTLITIDGLLDESFDVELRTKTLDEISLGQRLQPAELDGALPGRMPQLAYVEWSFGLTRTDAWFEFFGVVPYPGTRRSRARAEPPADAEPREGHSWGAAVELERARQR